MPNLKSSPDPSRIQSIDVLRGLTILVMIFVNDLAGVEGVPAWMKHISPHDADGMTFVDVVFPAFLFCVGMSIPFAIGRRLDRGESKWNTWKHILVRTFSLLAVGVFMVNTESIAGKGILPQALWSLLMYAGIILVWNQWKSGAGSKPPSQIPAVRLMGVVLLLILVFLYRRTGGTGLMQMRTEWWGIIGLIGWAYLVACVLYVLFRRQPVAMTGAVAILYCVFFADQAGFFSFLGAFRQWISIGSMWGSHAAIVVSGAILGMILMPDSSVQSPGARIRWAVLYGLGLAAAGHLLHSLASIDRMFIINKILASPPWCLWSSAFTVWVWVVIYWLVDVKGWKRWSLFLESAGRNALFAYILAPVIDCIIVLACSILGIRNFYYELGSDFRIGFWRALIFAFTVTWLAGGLRRTGIQLKL
jgi:heparan-alpha-glucosaminide N-acetyltransferase